ncbi:MAG: alanine--tRNA ligase [bacterium]
MKKFSSVEIREIWLKFFKDKEHSVEPSAPLVPIADKTLLWINAGVAPLKKYFDGSSLPENPRITNVQKCIRTNDIENVGKTARHHTFFEMMGNFSIGDYFKDDIIPWAYELLTSEEYFGIDVKKLYFTVYESDQAAYDKWVSLGIKKDHLIKTDLNYWQIGTGPCGPCTEIFYDRGKSYDKRGIELIEKDIENDRFIEIWNIVFSQYNATEGVDRADYKELPQKNIDTGAGLERFACVLQGVDTNYETDLFLPIIQKIEEISGVKYKGQMAFKVIADHVRTVSFALADGATFSNEGRGYVLRRVLRRAVKYSKKLNINKPFMDELVDTVVKVMGEFYPYLKDTIEIVKKMVSTEEEKFLSTIIKGEQKLEELLKDSKKLSGKDAFLLYDTFGFPIELTQEYVEEMKKSVDLEEFEVCMEEQKTRARSARKNVNSMNTQNEEQLEFKEVSEFVGYTSHTTVAKVIKVFDNGIVLDKTPFYAFSGGQLADKGTINGVEVTDVAKLPNGQHIHFSEGKFKEGDMVIAAINITNRHDTTRNHSATHLVQSALVNVLGSHIKQQGSQVSSEYTRFDFNNFNSLTEEEILNVEDLINKYINDASVVDIKEMSIEEAKQTGATALFGEKYGATVRVVNMGPSVEFCAGTHVKSTDDIKQYSIVSIDSIGSGTYRITGVTGNNMKDKLDHNIINLLTELTTLLGKKEQLLTETNSKSTYNSVYNKELTGYRYVTMIKQEIALVKDYLKVLNKEANDLKSKENLSNLDSYLTELDDNKLIIKVENLESKETKELTDALLNKIGTGIVFIASVLEDKAVFVCKNNIDKDSGALIKLAASISNGSGGGRKDMAQGGGKDLSKIDEVITAIKGAI